MVRFFRAGQIVAVPDRTWLVDESWPVALAVDPDGSTSVHRWDWPRTRVEPEQDHAALSDGVGIVVRDGEQVVWVRPNERMTAETDSDLWLSAADPTTAWFVDRTYVDPGDPPQPAPPLPSGRVVAIHTDGSRTEIAAVAPVDAVTVCGDQVWVTTALPPIAHPWGDDAWDFEYPTSVVSADRTALLAEGMSAARPAEPPTASAPGRSGSWDWVWLEDDPATILRDGVRAGGRVWWAGAPADGDPVERLVCVVGHDPSTGQEVARVDLGPGVVTDVEAVGDELWLSVVRRNVIPCAADDGVDVIGVSGEGSTRTIQAANTIDISRFAPPLHRPSQDEIDHHVETVRQMFDGLDAYWTDEGGVTSPLSDGLTAPSVTVRGDWPHTRVVVTLRHGSRPGLLLRRTLAVFDDEGRPVDNEFADINFMEDLDTGHLARAARAVDGVLDT